MIFLMQYETAKAVIDAKWSETERANAALKAYQFSQIASPQGVGRYLGSEAAGATKSALGSLGKAVRNVAILGAGVYLAAVYIRAKA